jgi:uncharacterized protein YehS (DUF1456 family)
MKDTMAIFRRIIGYIARINDCNLVKVEHIAQDIEIDIADLRVWLRLMESLGLVYFMSVPEEVILRLLTLDRFGFDTNKLKDL